MITLYPYRVQHWHKLDCCMFNFSVCATSASIYIVLVLRFHGESHRNRIVLCLRERERAREWVSDCVCSSDWVLMNICANGRTRRERFMRHWLHRCGPRCLVPGDRFNGPTLRISSNGVSWWRIHFFFTLH